MQCGFEFGTPSSTEDASSAFQPSFSQNPLGLEHNGDFSDSRAALISRHVVTGNLQHAGSSPHRGGISLALTLEYRIYDTESFDPRERPVVGQYLP